VNSQSAAVTEFSIRLRFHEALAFFLRDKSNHLVSKILREKTAVKDVIESCGVPHPEVDLILVDASPVDFTFPLRSECDVEVFGLAESPGSFPKFRLQARRATRFVADGHLGKLARYLRLLGIDVVYDGRADDSDLLEIMRRDERALLTRDRCLLMHAVVQHGYYPRSQFAEEQTREVIRRFELAQNLAPLSRCLHCNALLAHVAKTEIDAQLEPLTRLYYEAFRQCAGCGRIYWRGSHFQKLEARATRLMDDLEVTDPRVVPSLK